MSEPAISVEKITKLYRIGEREQEYQTLREALIGSFTAPFRNFKQLLNLTRFNDEGKSSLPETNIIYALKDVSFKVQQGEVLGIIGRNGAGKSTLLKILSRIIRPTKGKVLIRGSVASLLEIGTGFHPELTGRENIYMNGSILGMKRREINEKFDEIVAFSGVEKFLDTPVKRYSSGMYVRLAFAVAAHLEEDIMLVDEVLAVGDESFQRKCVEKMQKMAEEGRTVVFISHNLASIERLCPKSILLEGGQIFLEAETIHCIKAYKEKFG